MLKDTGTRNKHEHVAAMLRKKIVTGVLSPGDRLPTRLQLQERFGVACSTIQQALDNLARDGFVHAQGRRGTFVSTTPPHLAHLAVVFTSSQNYPSQFYAALSREAVHLSHMGRRVSVFYGIDGHSDVEDYQRLMRHVRTQSLGGLIFAARNSDLIDTGLLDVPDLAKVLIASESRRDGIPAVYPDHGSFMDLALRPLAQRGKRRVAWVGISSPYSSDRLHLLFQERVRRWGMTTQPYWVQSVGTTVAGWARNLAHLLVQPHQTQRPDALVIGDDNLVEPVTRGVMDAGVRVPDDLCIVAHTNFPFPAPAHVPIHRVGFVVHDVFQTCVNLIDAQRRRQGVPALTLIPAVAEPEPDAPRMTAADERG